MQLNQGTQQNYKEKKLNMLSVYHTHIIAYFSKIVEAFTYNILIEMPNSFGIIEDIVPRVIDFLDREFRKEMDMHAVHSRGYNYYMDLLIEIHREISDEFRNKILETISSAFKH